MAKFLTSNELNAQLEKLFDDAEKQLILISPYIKLHDRYISTLKTKINNPKIEITIVFGKNEADLSRSMKQEDFNFFKEFPNIEIRYEKRLHAKYYTNESSAILTSMNLYNFSQDNNIEAGVLTNVTMLGDILTSVTGEENFERTAMAYFTRVIEQSELLFKKIPEYESINLGLTKRYKSSKTEVDKLSDFFMNRAKYENITKKDYKEQDSSLKAQSIKESTSSKFKLSGDSKFLSTSALSKEIGISSKDLFNKFEKLNWIEKINNDWILTEQGIHTGAQTKKGQYGEYIAWPDTILGQIK